MVFLFYIFRSLRKVLNSMRFISFIVAIGVNFLFGEKPPGRIVTRTSRNKHNTSAGEAELAKKFSSAGFHHFLVYVDEGKFKDWLE